MSDPLDLMSQWQRQAQQQTLKMWEQFARGCPPPRERPGAATDCDVVYQAELSPTAGRPGRQTGSLRLLRYRRQEPPRGKPVLICFALVNRPYILDLQQDRSVVQQLLRAGRDVFLIDWGTPHDDDRALRLSDYVGGHLRRAVEHTCQLTGAPSLHLLGYCMGGTMSAMFTALHPTHVDSLSLMAAPIDFRGDGLLNVWARAEHFDVDGLIDAYGNCPGWLLQSCFQLMKPVHNFAAKYLHLCDRMDDDAFLDNFFAMERWANDNIPVAGETFREFVKRLFQRNELVGGQMDLEGQPVRLQAIRCPLLLLTASGDHLVPPASTLALKRHAGTLDVSTLSIDAGHIGLAVSSKAHRQLWPQAVAWLATHEC